MIVKDHILSHNNNSLRGIKGIRKFKSLLHEEVISVSDIPTLSDIYPCFKIFHLPDEKLAYYYEAHDSANGELLKFFTDNPIK